MFWWWTSTVQILPYCLTPRNFVKKFCTMHLKSPINRTKYLRITMQDKKYIYIFYMGCLCSRQQTCFYVLNDHYTFTEYHTQKTLLLYFLKSVNEKKIHELSMNDTDNSPSFSTMSHHTITVLIMRYKRPMG